MDGHRRTRNCRCPNRPALLLLLCLPAAAVADTWVVQPDGTGDVPTLQAAVDAAARGDTIVLGPGTFTGPGNRSVLVLGKDLAFQSMSGAGATIVDCEQASRALLVGNSEVTFSGITIRNGSPAAAGGAIAATTSVLTVSDCVFRDNEALGDIFGLGGGGALHVTGGRLAVSGCLFERNHASSLQGVGGAIALYSGCSATVEVSEFESNDTGDGQYAGGAGIMSWQAADVVVDGCTFSDNTSTDGVGVFLLATTVAVTECVFTGNSGRYAAEGITNGVVEFAGCLFADNAATGLGIFTDATVTDCTFLRNVTTEWGGGAHSAAANVMFTGCLFAGNAAANGGGGASILGGPPAVFDHCTFWNNEAPMGGSIVSRDAPVTVNHSILAGGNGGSVRCLQSATITASCSNVWGNAGGDYVACLAGQEGVSGNFGLDPAFCDPAGGDYSLRSDSPCAPPGVTGCGLVGALPVGCGPVSVEPASWGELKSWYRD